jgi:hypothetical protein
MTDARRVAEEFFGAWTGKDFNRARALHDDLSFKGPIDTFDDADAYLRALQGLSQIVTGATSARCSWTATTSASSTTSTPAPVPSAPTAEWYQVRDGRIAAIRVFFDARPFAPPFEGR